MPVLATKFILLKPRVFQEEIHYSCPNKFREEKQFLFETNVEVHGAGTVNSQYDEKQWLSVAVTISDIWKDKLCDKMDDVLVTPELQRFRNFDFVEKEINLSG